MASTGSTRLVDSAHSGNRSVILSVNPIGFMGDGWDDWQYLEAARCWRAHGPCLPHDHWQGSWPVIAPLAAITLLFGKSRLTVGIAPLTASIICLVLIAKVGNHLAGRPAGFVAALLFQTAPALSIQLVGFPPCRTDRNAQMARTLGQHSGPLQKHPRLSRGRHCVPSINSDAELEHSRLGTPRVELEATEFRMRHRSLRQ